MSDWGAGPSMSDWETEAEAAVEVAAAGRGDWGVVGGGVVGGLALGEGGPGGPGGVDEVNPRISAASGLPMAKSCTLPGSDWGALPS